jgi:hypothetical protein
VGDGFERKAVGGKYWLETLRSDRGIVRQICISSKIGPIAHIRNGRFEWAGCGNYGGLWDRSRGRSVTNAETTNAFSV